MSTRSGRRRYRAGGTAAVPVTAALATAALAVAALVTWGAAALFLPAPKRTVAAALGDWWGSLGAPARALLGALAGATPAKES
jgi:hypothetical protein